MSEIPRPPIIPPPTINPPRTHIASSPKLPEQEPKTPPRLVSTANTTGTAHGYVNKHNTVIDSTDYHPERIKPTIWILSSLLLVISLSVIVILLNLQTIIKLSYPLNMYILSGGGLLLLGVITLLYLLLRTRRAVKRIMRREQMQAQWEAQKHPKDDILPDARGFSRQQAIHGKSRAGGVCEYTHTKHNKRCTNKIREGDHFYPYTKGGATTLQNYVGACKWHNQTKREHIWEHEKTVIEQRRAIYFPLGEPITVGQWLDDFDGGKRTVKTEEELW